MSIWSYLCIYLKDSIDLKVLSIYEIYMTDIYENFMDFNVLRKVPSYCW